MKQDDILKRAIELYEKDKEKDGEIEKQSLSELNIPEKYYDRAKKELGEKQSKIQKLLIRNIIIIIVIVGIPIYLLVLNFVIPFPELIDHSFSYYEKTNELRTEVRILNQGQMKYELIYELLTPDEKIYDSRTTPLRIGSNTYPFATQFTNQPLQGTWKIRFRARLQQYGFNKKIIGELSAGPFH